MVPPSFQTTASFLYLLSSQSPTPPLQMRSNHITSFTHGVQNPIALQTQEQCHPGRDGSAPYILSPKPPCSLCVLFLGPILFTQISYLQLFFSFIWILDFPGFIYSPAKIISLSPFSIFSFFLKKKFSAYFSGVGDTPEFVKER